MLDRSTPRTRGVALGLLAAALLVAPVALLAGSAPAVASEDVSNVTAYRAEDATLGSAAAVEAAIENGTLDPAGPVVVGETLVVAVESERLAGAMAAGDGSTTERFLDAIDGEAEFRLVQTNPSPQRSPMVAPIGRGNVTVHRNGSTAYALVQTGDLTFRHGNGREAGIHGGERFAVRFGYDLDDRAGDSAPVVEFHPFESGFVTHGRWYEPLPPEWFRLDVDVNVAPEESLRVRLELDGGRTIANPVSPAEIPGSDVVWIDLRGVEPGTGYVLELVQDGDVTDRYAGAVREPRATVENVTLVEVTTELLVTEDGERVEKRIDDHAAVNATVRLSHGGKVRVYDESCEDVGFAWVDPGNETRVTMRLWEAGDPVRDPNRSEYGFLVRTVRGWGASQQLYPGGAAAATVGFDGTCRTPTPVSTPTVTRSPTPSSPTHSPTAAAATLGSPTTAETPRSDTPGDRGRNDTTDTPGQPGFGAPALLAALLLALLGARRVR